MRAVVEVEEDNRGRTILVVTELPYQVNPDNLAERIADLVKEGKLAGIADIRDESSGRTGMRLVLVLKRDAVAKVVLNNLYKHTQLQETFGANMLALVDGVPRTLNLAQFVRHYVAHQIEVIVRRTAYRLRKAEERAHILRGLVKALDMLDEVIALIRRSPTRRGVAHRPDRAARHRRDPGHRDPRHAAAPAGRPGAPADRRRAGEDRDRDRRLKDILAKPERQRQIVSEELAEIVARWGDERRTQIIPFDGEVSMEDLIAREDVVVTITRTGYAKRTKVDLYRSQKRGGKGVSGATLRQDDIVSHFFVCSTHDWILFFTNKGRVYRAKAYELPEASRVAKGQHVANLLAFQPDEHIAQVIEIAELPGVAIPGAGHQGRPGQEDQAGGVRLQPVRRDHRASTCADEDELVGRRAARPGGRPAPGEQAGPGDPLQRHRRRAAPDGPRNVGRDRDAVRRG